MAITPFDKPAEAPIMDTYVPIPFQELMQAGAMTQARYEDTLAKQEDLSSQVANVRGLSRVNQPGLPGQYIELPDQDVVKTIQEQYYKDLEELSSNLDINSGPEGRAKLKALATNFKRDMSPNGRIGIAQQNMQQVEEFNKMLRDNPELAQSPQMVKYIHRLRQHEKDVSDGQIKPLDLSGAAGEDVDVNERLVSLLKNYGEQAGLPGIERVNSIPGLIRELKASGTSREDIQQTVVDFLTTDRMSRDQLMLEAEYDQLRGADTTFEDLVLKQANIMGDVFSQSKIQSSTKFEPGTSERAARSEAMALRITSPVMVYDPNLGVSDQSDLRELKNTSSELIESTKMNLDVQMAKVGLKQDDSGKIVRQDGSKLTQADYLNIKDYEAAYEDAVATNQSYINLENKAKEISGFDPDEMAKKSDYYQRYAKDKEKFFWANKASNADDMRNWREEAVRMYGEANPNINQLVENHQRKRLDEKVIEESIDRLNEFGQMGSKNREFRDKYKKYNEALKDLGGANSYAANVKRFVTGSEQSSADSFIETSYASPDSMVGEAIIVTGEESGKRLKENKDLWDDLDISTKHKPKTLGLFIDKSENGAPKIMVQYYNSEGEIATRAKVDAPQELVTRALITNDTQMAEYLINAKLNSKLGVIEPYNSEQTVNLSYGDDEGGPIANIVMPSTDGTRNYITATVGGKQLEPSANTDELRVKLAIIAMAYENSKLNN